MVQELVYTSLENGLLPGSRGFSTVAMTEGLPQSTRALLESLSGYAHKFTGHDADYQRNPVAYSHLKDRSGNSIVSQISACDFDYTGRTNHLAHHIVLDGAERLPPDGPAAFMLAENVLFREWRGPAKYLTLGRLDMRSFALPSTRSCQALSWMATPVGAMGAAVLAQSFEESQKGRWVPTVYICFGLETGALRDEKLLSLIGEALALLPESLRWKVTFSTYFTSLPVGMQCDWRCVLEDDPGFAKQRAKSVWIDLVSGKVHNAGLLDCTAKLHIAQSGIRPATAKRNGAQPKTKVAPEASRIGMKPTSFSTSPTPNRNSMRTFDADKNRHEQAAKIRRDNIRFGLVLGGILVGALLVFGVVMFKLNSDTQKISTSSADTEENSSRPKTNNTQLAGNAPPEVSKSPSDTVKDLNNGEDQTGKPASTPVANGGTEPTGHNEVSTTLASVGDPTRTPEDPSDANKEIRLISELGKELAEGQWYYVSYFAKGNTSNESKLYKKDERVRTPPGDVLLFTKATSPVKYVYKKSPNLKWTELFFASPTTNASVAKPPEFNVERNPGLFEALQKQIRIKLAVELKEQNAQNLKQYKGVVFQAKQKEDTIIADDIMKGWKESPETMKKFCESAVDVEPYVQANFKRKKIPLKYSIKKDGTPFDIELDYDEFKFFREKKDEIEDAKKAEKNESGNKPPGGSPSPKTEKSPDIKLLRKEVADKAGHGLVAKDAEGFLKFIIEKQKDFDDLDRADTELKANMTAETKKGVVAAMRITFTLTVDVSFEKNASETFKVRYK